ncbi:MAG TPA: cytochrome P450, partial [Nitrososphaeraceae archaeon]|nr:cytochrome P450 [Nitrososphaeraceae archaeon]
MYQENMKIYPPIEQRFLPFEFYSLMRKNNPVAFDERNEQWGIYRYSDIEKILRDPIKFSPKFGPFQVPQEYQENLNRPSLLNTDPPYHRKLRSIVDTLFVPIEISRLEPRIENIANELIDNIIEKGNNTMDLVTDFAYPLPATVIAELLGVPSEDHDTFHQWADNIVSLEITSDDDIDSIRKTDNTVADMDIYFSKLIEKKKKMPTNDLISHIIRAKVDGHSLSEKEILSFCSLLLNAGHVTTVNLIGNLVFSLLENPQEFKRLQEHQNSLIKPAIEETLRYRSPVQFLLRIANADVTLSEGREERGEGIQRQEIQKGQGITLFLGSANYDESIFTDPERFDITRKNLRHLAFGTGIHFCLGAPLARLEGQIALRIILERFKNLQFNFDYSDRQDLYTKVSPLKSSFLLGLS